MDNGDIEAIKKREQKFREKDIPFGEFTVETKTRFWNEIELRNVFSHSEIKDKERVLDVGCSDGRLLEYVNTKLSGCELYGIDFAESHLNVIRNKDFESHLVCGDICKMLYKPNFFDHIFSIQVIQQIPTREERIRVLKKINNILKNEGTFVLTVLNRKSWHNLVKNGKEGPLLTAKDIYVYLYDPGELRADLEEAGFFVEVIAGINNFPVRYLEKLHIFGVFLDLFITRFLKTFSLSKGRYILASCRKK